VVIRKVRITGSAATTLDFILPINFVAIGCDLSTLLEPPLVPRGQTTTRWTVTEIPGAR
jgi:hypothetical protein